MDPDTYVALDGRGAEVELLPGNTGYTRQAGSEPQAQSRMRRCVVRDDATGVRYYLDCDDSTKIAGSWDGSVQTGWVRVHEGYADPVRPLVGQPTSGHPGLRPGVPSYSAVATYQAGDRVLYANKLWDSLANQTGVTPAAGTSAANLSGTDGQVMVEIPATYYRWTFTSELNRHEYEVLFDSVSWKPFPNLAVASTLPASRTVTGRSFDLHPAFLKGGVQRPARYIAAFGTSASDTGNNPTGVLRSIANGSNTNTTGVSNTNFRLKARNRNTGLTDPSGAANNRWQLSDYWLHSLLNLLFITEFRTLYSQGVLGAGNVSGAVFNKIAGRSAPLGNASGNFNSSGALVLVTQTGTDGVVWRGIEDLWGSAWTWVDGWNVQVDAGGVVTHYVANDPATYGYSSGSAPYTLLGVSEPFNAAQRWPSKVVEGTLVCAPDGVAGSASTYLTDAYSQTSASVGWRVPALGGSAGSSITAGLAALSLVNGPGNSVGGNGAVLSL